MPRFILVEKKGIAGLIKNVWDKVVRKIVCSEYFRNFHYQEIITVPTPKCLD